MSDPSRSVSTERVVHAPADRVFAVLADPAQHCLIDGSGSLKRNRDGNPERLSLGATFSMDMRIGVPYRITNEVVEFDEGRRIGWQHFARNVWRYELDSTDDGTRVRETFDYSRGRGQLFLRLTHTPEKNRKSMEQTLERLAALVEGGGASEPA